MPPFRTLQAPRTDPYAFANVQAFTNILNALGKAETLRKNRFLRTRVMQAISMGAGPEDIASIVGQQVPYSPGLTGVFQRIGEMFGPQTTPIEEEVTQNMLEQMFRTPTISDIRLKEYYKAVAAGDKERADKLLMSSLVNVQVGQKLLTEGQRKDIAEKDYQEKMGLSASEKDLARKSVKTIIRQIEPSRWQYVPGAYNFRQDQLTQAYKQYQNENDYSSKTEENRKWLDDVWDGQIETYNKAGYPGHGTKEFDWDPKDKRIKELRVVSKNPGMTLEKLFEEYGEAIEELTPQQRVMIDKVWNEAVKNNVSGKKFMETWKRLKRERGIE